MKPLKSRARKRGIGTALSVKAIGVEKFVAKPSSERLTSNFVPVGLEFVDHVTVKDEKPTTLKTGAPGAAARV